MDLFQWPIVDTLFGVSRHLSTYGAAHDYGGRNVWLFIHILADQDPKMGKEASLAYKLQGSDFRELLPPSRPCLPKALQSPQTVTSWRSSVQTQDTDLGITPASRGERPSGIHNDGIYNEGIEDDLTQHGRLGASGTPQQTRWDRMS